jgi:hypothetical protein
MNAIPALPQSAKKAHFFHMNKKIMKITFRSPNIAKVQIAQIRMVGMSAAMKPSSNKYAAAVPAFAGNIRISHTVNSAPRSFSDVAVILFF